MSSFNQNMNHLEKNKIDVKIVYRSELDFFHKGLVFKGV
jgi:hypothetical protein